MTENEVQNQSAAAQENKVSDKELNFRALESKYRRELEQERAARAEAERRIQEYSSRNNQQDDDDDDEPYVDKRRLEKRFSSFEQRLDEKIEKKAEEKARNMMQKEKQEAWLKTNSDFYDVMQHVEKFANHDPELAETILHMPDSFERQKLVYKNIKALGLHQEKKQPSIQDKIDANRRGPYYQPSGVSAAPYASSGDFSSSGQENAYKKMKELQSRLRM